MIIITGMHRSGTSAVCNLLSEIGLDFGPPSEFLPADRWNNEGYFENREVFLLNNRIITGDRTFSKYWLLPYEKRNRIQRLVMLFVKARYLSMPSSGLLKKRTQRSRNEIKSLSDKFNGTAVKDPRFCLLLGAWNLYGEVERVLFVYRNPSEVVLSLKKREGLPARLGYVFWRYHVDSFLSHLNDIRVPSEVVKYEDIFSDETRKREGMCLFRFTQRRFVEESWEEIYARNFKPTLRHHVASDTNMPSSIVNTLKKVENVRAQSM